MTTKIPVELSSTPGIVDGSNATAITIDSSENVGINETSPFGRLHISDTQTGRTSADSTANTLVIEDDEGGMSILSSNSGAGYILFGDVADSAAGGLLYDHSADRFRFRTNAAWDRMILDSSGRLLISTTTEGRAGEGADMLTIGDTGNNSGMTMRSGTSGYGSIYFSDATSGIGEYSGYVQYAHNGDMMLLATGSHTRIRIDSDGLKFGSDSAAANALDDYEEGNYTATITCASGSIALYSSYDTLAYTKIGRKVHVQGKLTINSVSSPSGATTINLPFTIGDLTDRGGFCTHMGLGYFNGSAISSGFHGIYMEGSEGTAYIRPYVMKPSSTAGNAPSTNNLGDDYVAQGSDIYINFSYITT
jgi:hypothetical protein